MTERRRVRVDGRRKLEPVPDSLPTLASEAAECDCPRLDPADWDRAESDWADITFVKTGAGAFLGVPVGFAGARSALVKKAREVGATVPDDPMMLLGEGKFRRPFMLEVEDAPPGAKGIVRPRGIAYTRIVSAPWGKMRSVVDEAADEAKEKYGRPPDDLWVWYLTCKVCSVARDFETLIAAHYATAP
jgi:hypothetical protein